MRGELFLQKAGTALCLLPIPSAQTPSPRAILSYNQLNNLFQNSRIVNPQVPHASINQLRHTPCSYNVQITASKVMAQRQASLFCENHILVTLMAFIQDCISMKSNSRIGLNSTFIVSKPPESKEPKDHMIGNI